ncbi:serine protease grass-like isoform X2 [Drosophila albomicans]|uniref:CLIP domain-containing serine protease n=1 Tax=Drosophila albomicans TaxID=7291 RepID=A0A6P8WKT4_DROAB|nr:serine protease grass-like isoform X1 [Drosophila albomicans]XP_051860267.1 serine protease grass-like isoform X2 [Drosophila albomicans]
MFKLSVIFILVFGSAIAFAPIDVERNADALCIRGDSKPGYCVLLRQCSFIKNILSEIRPGIPPTPTNKLYIQKSKCGSRPKNTRHVCCEENEKIDQAIHDLSTEDCGRFETDKIIGGKEIQLMSRPWMALLNFRNTDGKNAFTCGGTLINKRYVLTAAHCFTNQKLLYVRLGEHNISQQIDCKGNRCAPSVEDMGIERIFVHEKYSHETGHNDIALVKLSKDVEFRESIMPICLPTSEILQNKVKTTQRFRVTGWGKTENTDFSDVPMETGVNRVDHSICQNSYHREISSTQICTGSVGKDSCNGDSGGPLSYVAYLNDYQRFVQYGVVSFGSQTCGDGHPGVYTNVGSYIRWIAYKIATK